MKIKTIAFYLILFLILIMHSKSLFALNNCSDNWKDSTKENKSSDNIVTVGDDTFTFQQKPLLAVNGFVMKNKKDFYAIPPNQILSVSVLKGNNTFRFGARIKQAVVEIITKDDSLFANNKVTISETSDSDRKLPDVKLASYYTNNSIHMYADYVPATSTVAAIFPGGVNEWMHYLQKNVRPVLSDNEAPYGEYKITISFLVDTLGKVCEPRITSAPSSDYGTSKEAIRIIMHSGFWNPASMNGKKISYRMTQKLIFSVEHD
ncbi:MAG: TonB-dependent receptor plug domain-containing protein [Arachidicoccus sp.]|nr:TonB-dependent receptor plug domain-containing protein [Arachidicoccus sp.]